jgi:hypothetical protein
VRCSRPSGRPTLFSSPSFRAPMTCRQAMVPMAIRLARVIFGVIIPLSDPAFVETCAHRSKRVCSFRLISGRVIKLIHLVLYRWKHMLLIWQKEPRRPNECRSLMQSNDCPSSAFPSVQDESLYEYKHWICVNHAITLNQWILQRFAAILLSWCSNGSWIRASRDMFTA